MLIIGESVQWSLLEACLFHSCIISTWSNCVLKLREGNGDKVTLSIRKTMVITTHPYLDEAIGL